ncbi:MAG: twin-arginine translocase subunit TatC [Alphaproteobacteria bacterium]|nr:twin-arginine translocase subunit TatC [Alphaproteobacteria bacterium]
MMNKKDHITSHFSDFRNKLISCFLFFLISFGISYYFSDLIFAFLASPLENNKMIYTNLTEGFFTYLKVAYFGGLFLSIPFCLIQLWRFISPGLYINERKAILPFIIMTPILFYLGGAFVYFLVIPNAWSFFLSFQSDSIELTAKISEYLSLIMSLIIAFGLCFETPVILSLLVKIGIVSFETLKKARKYFIIIAFILGAFLTPPDVISQLILASVIVILFELSLIFIKLSSSTQRR